jgi:hypothetical protein
LLTPLDWAEPIERGETLMTCARCGARNEPDWRYCQTCGMEFTTGSAGTAGSGGGTAGDDPAPEPAATTGEAGVPADREPETGRHAAPAAPAAPEEPTQPLATAIPSAYQPPDYQPPDYQPPESAPPGSPLPAGSPGGSSGGSPYAAGSPWAGYLPPGGGAPSGQTQQLAVAPPSEPPMAPAGPVPPPPAGRSRTAIPWWMLVITAVLLVATAVMTPLYFTKSSEASRKSHELAATRSDLNHKISGLRQQLRSSDSDLRKAQAQVKDLQSDLTGTNNTNTDLRTCLQGLLDAINLANRGDQAGTQKKLNDINGPCTRTGVNF